MLYGFLALCNLQHTICEAGLARWDQQPGPKDMLGALLTICVIITIVRSLSVGDGCTDK